MASCTRLPPALLELVLAQASSSWTLSLKHYGTRSILAAAAARRYSHAATLKTSPSVPPPLPPTLPLFSREPLPDFVRNAFPELAGSQVREMTELERRVKDLTRISVSSDAASDDSVYSENELLQLYEDLLAAPRYEEQEPDASPAIDDNVVLRSISERITSLQSLNFDHQISAATPLDPHTGTSGSAAETYMAAASKEEYHTLDHGAILAGLTEFIKALGDNLPAQEEPSRLPITPGILTEAEWSVLAKRTAESGDLNGVYNVFDLMKHSATPITENALNGALSVYADNGDVKTVESLLQKYLTASPTVAQRDLHVKSYLKISDPTGIPTRALAILHDYEARALPAPQQTYTRCITHLFSARSSVAHAHAWDLFSHMRYAAHPVPDALLYTLMIRACASASFSTGVEPERALDLFHEMTVDQRMEPTSGAYTATILACACSGRKDYVHEAFRLAKEMLDAHRDARGDSPFAPDTRFFKALLEGAKRIGDLARARWLLAEMVKLEGRIDHQTPNSAANLRVDDQVIVHVFNAYATYKPPFRRSATQLLDGPADEASTDPGTAEPLAAPVDEAQDVVPRPQQSTFTHLPPQTHAELICEVKLLMDQIVEQHKSEGHRDHTGRFKHVELTSQLVNAYLSVHYAHSPLEDCVELYRSFFTVLAVPKTAKTYVDALERFSKVRKDQRAIVKPIADEIWAEWEAVETAWRKGDSESLQVSARLVERANAAMIRLLSITGQLDRALKHVRAFVEAYPSAAVRTPPPQLAARSTRTLLAAARPLVRLTSAVDIPDDTVPPMLTFTEVELLHHKLVATRHIEGIKYLKWVCKSYEGALRARREKTLQARELVSDAPSSLV